MRPVQTNSESMPVIKLVRSSFYHELETKRALAEFVLNAEIFSMSTQCREFERAFAEKQGRKHAVYVANGSVADLLLVQSMMSLGHFKPNDKIGFSALTWPTNVMPLIQLGLQPVPIDCELGTLNVSPRSLRASIDGLRGLFLTNVLGFCDDLSGVKSLCDDANVTLIEDNCESLGSRCDGRLLGNFGLAATFSFFVGHHLSTIEGGMVVTDDDELHQSLVIGRAHGWDRNLKPEAQQKLRGAYDVDDFYANYTFYELASNFRPTEINGFIGNTQLKFWDEIVERRASNYAMMSERLSANPDFYSLDVSHMDLVSNFAVPVVSKTAELGAAYRKKFADAGVEIRPIIAGNMTHQPFYRNHVDHSPPLPNSDTIHTNGFYFGNHAELTKSELDLLANLLDR
jgi:CDP-6-deoxy-D-xylo-4-hexulose-3-dehydrase